MAAIVPSTARSTEYCEGDPLARRSTHGTQSGRVAGKRVDQALRQRVDVAHRKRRAGDAIAHEIGAASHLVADDRRNAARHRLVDDQPPGLAGVRRQHEAIGRDIGADDFRLVEKAGKGHRQALPLDQRARLRHQFTVAHDQHVRRRARSRLRAAARAAGRADASSESACRRNRKQAACSGIDHSRRSSLRRSRSASAAAAKRWLSTKYGQA